MAVVIMPSLHCRTPFLSKFKDHYPKECIHIRTLMGSSVGSACDENWMMGAGLHHSPSSIVQRLWSGVSKPALKSVSRLTSETKELLGPGLFGDLEAWTHSTSDVTRETREKV